MSRHQFGSGEVTSKPLSFEEEDYVDLEVMTYVHDIWISSLITWLLCLIGILVVITL